MSTRPVSEDLNVVFQLAVLSGPRVIWHDLTRTQQKSQLWRIRSESLPFNDADKTTKRPRTGSDIIQMTRPRLGVSSLLLMCCVMRCQRAAGFYPTGTAQTTESCSHWRRRMRMRRCGLMEQRGATPPHALQKRKKSDCVLMALHPLRLYGNTTETTYTPPATAPL